MFYAQDHLFLKKDNHFEKVNMANILVLEADSNYTHIQTTDQRFIYSVVLKKIEELLQLPVFKRLHRSFVLNTNAITGFEGNMLFIQQHKIQVSKLFHEAIFKMLHKI